MLDQKEEAYLARRYEIIVLFHSVLGLRPAIQDWAERLREKGHRVHTPDLYGDETAFVEMDDAVRHRDGDRDLDPGRASPGCGR